MDPIANVIDQLLHAQQVQEIQDNCNEHGEFTPQQLDLLADHAGRLAELVSSLNRWLIGGGFNPYQSTQALHDIKRLARVRGWNG